MADHLAELDADAPDSGTLERYNADQSQGLAIRSLDDIKRISTIFIQSGMFKGAKGVSDVQQLYQAGVKIIAGVEFGIQPFAAMRGINIISGNAEMSANLMAAKVKKHPKYDYRVKKWDSEGCVLTFFEIPRPGAPRSEWDELGDSSFDMNDARTAGLANGDNWRKFARNMFFARAMSNGVRIFTPDVFYGAPVYVEGEISGDFDQVEPTHSEPEADAEPAKPVEAEIVEQVEPVTEEASTHGDAWEVIHNAGLSDTEIRRLTRDITGKPFLKNCTPEEVEEIASEVLKGQAVNEGIRDEA